MTRWTARTLGLALTASAVALLPAVEASAASATSLVSLGTTQPVTFDAVVGGSVFFSTAESLTANDLDAKIDVYRWRAGKLTLMTPGTGQDVQFDAASRNGDVVFGSTREGHLTGTLYLCRFTATGGGEFNTTATGEDAIFRAASADGSTVLFESAEDAIDLDDDHGAVDVFAAHFQDPALTTVDQLPVSNNTLDDVHLEGWSADLRSIVYSTDEKVDPVKDQNTTTDLYGAGDVWGGPGYPPLLSDGVGGPDTFGAIAANGASIVYTSSDDNAAAGDTDGQPDVYWSMGIGADLISAGTSPATYAGASPGLGAVFYRTQASLDVADTDGDFDIYTRSPDLLPALVSTESDGSGAAHLHAVSAAAEVVYDVGGRLFESDGSGASTAVSPPSPQPAVFAALTAGGDVLFSTDAQLSSLDTDASEDVYVEHGGVVSLVSRGNAEVPAAFEGASVHGALVVYSTTERLSTSDTDDVQDLYVLGPALPPPPDTVPPKAAVTAATQKNDGTIEARLACGSAEACTATPAGKLLVPSAARGKVKFAIKGKTVTVPAGKKATLKLKVPKKAKKAAAAALKAGRTVKAKIVVTVADQAGNKRTVRVTVKLKS